MKRTILVSLLLILFLCSAGCTSRDEGHLPDGDGTKDTEDTTEDTKTGSMGQSPPDDTSPIEEDLVDNLDELDTIEDELGVSDIDAIDKDLQEIEDINLE